MVYGLYGLMDSVLDDIFAEAVETASATTSGRVDLGRGRPREKRPPRPTRAEY